MDLQDLGALGELVGAVATIGTLLYLAMQIRANNRLGSAEARRTAFISEVSDYGSIVSNQEVADIFNRGLQGMAGLDESERTRFSFLLAPFLGHTQLEYKEVADGLRSRVDYERNFAARMRFLLTPGGKEFWEMQRTTYDPGFSAEVDAWLARDHTDHAYHEQMSRIAETVPGHDPGN